MSPEKKFSFLSFPNLFPFSIKKTFDKVATLQRQNNRRNFYGVSTVPYAE